MQRNDVMTAQLVFSSHAVKETFGKALWCAGVIEATTSVWIVPADAKAMHHDQRYRPCELRTLQRDCRRRENHDCRRARRGDQLDLVGFQR